MERKDKKWFKRDTCIIVLISFLIVFVSISFLVNIGKQMSLPGFRTNWIGDIFEGKLATGSDTDVRGLILNFFSVAKSQKVD